MIGLNLRLVAAAAIAVALAASHWKAYTQGEKSVQAAWNVEKLELARQTLRLVDARDRTTQDLQDGAAAQRKAKNERIKALDADLAAALGRLSDRPDRPSPSSVPTDTGTGSTSSGSTGKELFRDDAEFLTRLAGEADRLVFHLGQCQAAYDQARRALN